MLFILWRSISKQNFMVPRWLLKVLHPPKKFERPPFWNGWRYGIKKYAVEVTFSGMTFLLNCIKIYQLVQKLLRGGYIDRQTGDLISLTFLFMESRIKRYSLFSCYVWVWNLVPLVKTRTQIEDVWKQNAEKGLDLRGMKWHVSLETCIMRFSITCIMRFSITCIHHQVLLRWGNQGVWDLLDM
jgi:hypothetical protein